MEADVIFHTLHHGVQNPGIIAGSGFFAGFSAAGHFFYTIVILCQIWPDIDGFQHWFMDNGLVADRKLQKQRQPFVGHALVLASTADMYVFIAIAPIIRQADGETLRTLGYKKEVQVGPLFHHHPGFLPPLISRGMKKIRSKAGIYIIAVRLELIFSLPILLYGQIERDVYKRQALLTS